MQRFTERDVQYAYSSDHAPIGTVQPDERFEVETVDTFSGYFRRASDFTPENYALAEAKKWAVTGPIAVAGARAGGAVAVTIHDVRVTTPGIVGYGSYGLDLDPLDWWDEELGCEAYPIEGNRLRVDDATVLETAPLVGCLAVAPADGPVHAKLQGRFGGNLDSRDLRAGATVVLPVSHDGAALYLGDCKALMGEGEIVGPPEIGAVVTASAAPRDRPAAMTWPRVETATALMTLVSGRPLEWSARQAFRELLEWVVEEFAIERPKAALVLAMVANAGICQISNDDYTAYCRMPRAVLLGFNSRIRLQAARRS